MAKVEINAKLESVWEALIRTENYQLWNAFTPRVETSWEIGTKVLLTVRMHPDKKPIQQKENLRKLTPLREMAWGINWGPFLKAERVQHLTEKADGTVVYFTEDVIWGMLSPIVHLTYGKFILQGFHNVAEGLKSYCEDER